MTDNLFADLIPNNAYLSDDESVNANNSMTDNPYAEFIPGTDAFIAANAKPIDQPKPEVLAPVAQPQAEAPVEQENDSPNSPVTDFLLRDPDTFFGEVNRGMAESASDLGGGLVRFIGQSADELGDWLEERIPLGVIDIDSDGISWRPSTKEDIAQPSFLLPLARTMEGADFGYKESTTIEDVKNEPLTNALPWALKTGLVSLPHTAAALLAMPAYIAARDGQIGQNRAENKGKENATFQDFIEVLPSAVGSAVLERFGGSKVLGLNTPAKSIAEVPGALLKRGLTEGGTEAIDEVGEYAAETVGTNVAFEPDVAGEKALFGALSGTVTGTAIASAVLPGEIALNGGRDSGPKKNSDGSGSAADTRNPAFNDPNVIAVTGNGTVVYKEGTAPEVTTPDQPTSEAPDIAQVEVDINAQRAELDDDLAKIMADLDKPLGISVPPPFDVTTTDEVVVDETTPQVELNPFSITDDAPPLDADALTITADDMAQMDLDSVEDQAGIDKDIAAYEASIAPLASGMQSVTGIQRDSDGVAQRVEMQVPSLALSSSEPAAPVKNKLLSNTEKAEKKAEQIAQRKVVNPAKDDFLTAIAKSGGIARESADGVDPADFRMLRGGLNPVFRLTGGTSLDDMNTLMSQYGYIEPNSDVNEFSNLLQEALRGGDVVSTANTELNERREEGRTEDFVAQGGVVPEAQDPVISQDQTITSALEEARNLGLPESDIDSILTNYPKESDAVLQLQMSMGGIELGDSSGTSNQTARVGDIRPERDVQQVAGTQGLAGQNTNDRTGSGDNGTQDGTNEVGVLLSPSATSGDPIANSEAGSGGGSDSAGLSGTNAGETVPLDGTMLPTERSRIETKLSAMSTKDFATTLKKTGLLKTGTKQSKIKRIVDAREGAEAMAQFESFQAFVDAVSDDPTWQDRISTTTISKSDLLRWANATKMKGELYSLESVMKNADNLYGWATATGALNIPRTSEKSQYEGESSMQASARATDERIKASKKATESYSHFSRLDDPSLTQEQIQTNYEAMVAGEDKRIVQAEKDSKALESVDTETQTEETSVDLLQTVRMGLMSRMKAPQAKFFLKRGNFPEPSAARMDELITKAGYMGASSQGPDFELISANSPSYQELGIEEYTESEKVWVQVKLLSDKKLRYRGDFLSPTDSFIEEVANNKANLKAQTEESFGLEAQTEQSLAASTELAATAATEAAAKTKAISSRAKADAELSGFMLTGSDAPADIAAANGQDDMFAADSNGTGQDTLREDDAFIDSEDSAPEDGGQKSLFGGLFTPKNIPKKAKLQQIQDNFRIRYEQVESGQIAVGLDTITNPNDAAHVVASIRKQAQETLMAVVTDEKGKILNVIRHSKGGNAEVMIYNVELVGAVAATKGAKKVWFAHNHPSGEYGPSTADALSQQTLEDTLDGTGIVPQGHIVVAPGSKKLGYVKIVGVNRQQRLEGDITPLARTRSLKVTERILRKRRMKDAPVVKNDQQVMAAAKNIESSNAIILMSKNNIIGSITMSSSEMLTLRKDGQVTRILAAISETNANGVIIKTDNEAAAENVNRFLNREQINIIIQDWVVNGRSLVGTGDRTKLNTKGPFFSKSAILSKGAKPRGVSEDQARSRVNVFLGKYKGADDVQVWVRATQESAFGPDSRKRDGDIVAGFYPDQNAVVLILENLDSLQDIDAAIQHELLVHKGLGLFKAEDVTGLIDVIKENAANSTTLKKMWADVQDKYKKETLEVQAEELLAKVAEKKMSKPDKYWNKIVTYIRDMLRKIGFVKEISFSDLRKRVYDMGEAFIDGRRAERREGFTAKTNETKSPSSDGLSGSKGFNMKKDKDSVRPNPSMIDMSKRPDKSVKSKTSNTLGFTTNDKDVQAKIPKTNEGDGTADVTIYGVDADGKRMLVAKNRKGGWDIVVDRRVDGEMFTDGKPIEYTAKNRKGVANRIESLGLTLEEVINKYPPAQREVLNEADSFFMASSTFLERRRFDFQDRFLSALKVQKAIEDFTFEQISEDMDFYNRETLKHGVTTAQITEFNDVFIEPLFDLIKKNDLTITDVGNFLYARHAPEANAEMKRRNAAFEDNESKSGMSDVDAAKIMADFKAAGKMDILNGIAATTDRVIERTRQILVETGLLSEATVQGYRDQYDVYVPLLGDPMDPEGKEKMKKSKDESRFGRSSRADNVLINLIVQHEQTIIRGEANVLKRVMLKLVEQNPNPDFWVIDKTTEEKVLDPVTDLFKLKEVPNKGNSKHVVGVRVAGEEHLIVFEQSNDHAMMLAGSMNNINAQQVNMITQAGLKFNRYVSMINTQYNLEFMPTNLARDIQTALINVYQYDDVDNAMVGRISKNVRKSIKGIRDYQKGRRDGETARWYDEFYKNGAQTGWLDNYESMASRGRQLDMMMKRRNYASLDFAYNVVEYISDMNTAYENGVRLSTYIELRKAGYSIQKASIAAKNLTVNFNRRGDKALLAGSLYVFFNASMQGNAAIIQAAQHKAVRKAMMAVFGMQVALEMMNRLLGGEDEDGQSVYSKIPLYIRNNNWVFLLPDFGDSNDAAKRLYIKIPVPYGYNVINVAAQVTGAAASQLLGNRDYDGLDAGVGLTRIWGALVHGFNPVGSDASVLQAFSPTLLDPLVQQATNENFAGSPIQPEQIPFGPPKPDSMMFWKSTPEYIKSISSMLNNISGGTDIRPGALSVSPEAIEHYNSFFVGGAGRFAKDMVSTPAMVVTSQETELRDYPWIRKFLGQVGDRSDVDNYYKATTDVTYAQRAFDAAKNSSDNELEAEAAMDKVLKSEGHLIDLVRQVNAANNFITSERARKADYELNEEGLSAERNKARINGVDRDIRKRRTTFVSFYRRAIERHERNN